jgi:hypothetical protein
LWDDLKVFTSLAVDSIISVSTNIPSEERTLLRVISTDPDQVKLPRWTKILIPLQFSPEFLTEEKEKRRLSCYQDPFWCDFEFANSISFERSEAQSLLSLFGDTSEDSSEARFRWQ